MCGACGGPATTWAERLAPLGGRGGVRRARALEALAPGVRAAPTPGGGLVLRPPGRTVWVASLPAAAAELTRRRGPLVPGVDTVAPAPWSPEDVAVWCAAVHAGGGRGVVVAAFGHRVTVGDRVVVTPSPSEPGAALVEAPDALARHWRCWAGR